MFDKLSGTTAPMHTEACGASNHEAVGPACTCTVVSARTGSCTRLVPLKWEHFKCLWDRTVACTEFCSLESGACDHDRAHRPSARGADGLQIIEGSYECNEQAGRDCRKKGWSYSLGVGPVDNNS
jgi:hypothetical protein